MQKKIFALNLLIILSCIWLTNNIQAIQETKQNIQQSEVSLVKQELQQQVYSEIFEVGGQWKDIQKSENDFNWDLANKIYSYANKNKLNLKWIIEIDSQKFPEWTKTMSFEQKKQSLLHFFSKICERYENVEYFILRDSNRTEGIRLAGEISKLCIKRHFIIEKKVEKNSTLIQQQNLQNAIQENNQIKSDQNLSGDEKGTEKMISSRLLQSTAPVVTFNLNAFGYTVSGTANVQLTAGRTVKSYNWDFGGGFTVTTSSAQRTYPTPGQKTVTLIVTDSADEVSTPYTQTITVPTTLPVASFTSSVKKRSVNFDASSSNSAFGTIVNYGWDFGDSLGDSTQTKPTTSYVYAAAGSFQVTLTVTDNKGAVGVISDTVVTVNNVLPTATINVVSIFGNVVNVEAIADDTDGVVLFYEWDWGVDEEPLGDTQSASFFYTTEATFTITLVVIDDDQGRSVAVTQDVVIPTNNPIASFQATVNRTVVTFDASSSVSVLGEITNYIWTFGDGQSAETNENTITHTYTEAKEYEVKLNVTDDQNLEGVEIKKITTVLNTPPVAGFNYTKNYLTVTFESNSTDDSRIDEYTWNFGYPDATGSGRKVTHTFPSQNTYTVVLTVTDDDGVDETYSQDIQVADRDPLPVASFTAQANNLLLKVDASASTSETQIQNYNWSWGDGQTQSGTSATADHLFEKQGIYLVALTVENSAGDISRILEKVILVLAEQIEKVIKAWKEEISIIARTTSDSINRHIISKSFSDDGTIRSQRYFSKTSRRAP